MSTVFIIHTRLDSLLSGKYQYIERIGVYRNFLKQNMNHEISIILYAWTSDIKLQSIGSHENIFKKIKPSNIIKDLRDLKTRISVSNKPIIVLGDNYWSWIVVFWLKLSLGGNLPTQISIHNSPDFREFRTFPSKLLRKMWLRFTLRIVDSIRLVNLEQLSLIPENVREKCVVSPIIFEIPINISHISSRVVGFSGRIHNERGLDEWAEIVRKTFEKSDPFGILILGEGDDSQSFFDKLHNISNLDVNIPGYLLGNNYFSNLNKVGVLLSCAKNESYGVSIRQAACLGIPVVARKNIKTQELAFKYPSLFYIYESIPSAVERLSHILKGSYEVNKVEVEELYSDLLQERDSSLRSLISSWLKLSNKN